MLGLDLPMCDRPSFIFSKLDLQPEGFHLELAARLRKLLQIMWQSVHFDIMALNKYLILTKFGALVISDHEER